MELSGLQIFKYLPGAKKTENANCKKCGFPTCMAYSLKLAKKQTSIEKCPYAPDDLKNIFQEASKIQQHEYSFGNSIKIGGETVMFRHEKTFVNKTVIAVSLFSNDKDFDKKADMIENYSVERVGEEFKVQAIYLIDKGNLIKAAEKLSQKGFGLIIETDNFPKELEKFHPIVNSKNEDLKELITANGNSIEEIEQASTNLIKNKKDKIVLNLNIQNKKTSKIIDELTKIRTFAIKDKKEAFTFPVMTILPSQNILKEASIASLLICRYSNILVFEEFNPALLTTIFTLRQNIYTDPQKPLQVESKIYELNNPDENAIVVMTTNFALTYFAVSNELESTGLPIYLVIMPSDGMSVLTAWSADKFTPEMAAKMISNSKILQKVKNKKVVIPGLLSHIKDDIQEELPEWEVIVGTNEAYKIQDFFKKKFGYLKNNK